MPGGGSLTGRVTTRCCLMCRVKMAWDRDDWTFIAVLAVVRERAPDSRHLITCRAKRAPCFLTWAPLSKPGVPTFLPSGFSGFIFSHQFGPFRFRFSDEKSIVAHVEKNRAWDSTRELRPSTRPIENKKWVPLPTQKPRTGKGHHHETPVVQMQRTSRGLGGPIHSPIGNIFRKPNRAITY